MDQRRRTFLQIAASVSATVVATVATLRPILGWAAETRPAFEATSLDAVLEALGASGAKASAEISLKAPDIAENGAVVPVEIESRLPGTRSIAIIVEKNPHTMSADFAIPDGTDPFIATRVKVAETSNVHALVKTDAGAFFATKLVKVTLGGCGG